MRMTVQLSLAFDANSHQHSSGAKLEGGVWGCVTPPQKKTQKKTNHLDWQGESSGLAGQSKNLNDRM